MKDLSKTDDKWLSEDELEIVKSQFFPPTSTDNEIKYCLGVAKAFNLNPILKQIYFVPRGSWFKQQGQKDKWVEKVEPLAGRDSFLTLAHRSGAFESIESTTEVRNIPFLDGTKWTEKNELVGICKVWKKGYKKPFKVEVNYSEYVQKKKDGGITAFWKDKPHTMIKKVAESQCLRKAFDITGLYDESETSINYKDEEIETVPTENKKPLTELKLNDEVAPTEKTKVQISDEYWKNATKEQRSKMIPILDGGLSSKSDDELDKIIEKFKEICL